MPHTENPTQVFPSPGAPTIVMTGRTDGPQYDRSVVSGAPFSYVELPGRAEKTDNGLSELTILIPDSAEGDDNLPNRGVWSVVAPDGSTVRGHKLAELIVGDMGEPAEQGHYVVISGIMITEHPSKGVLGKFTQKPGVFVVARDSKHQTIDVTQLAEGEPSVIGREFRGGEKIDGGIAMPLSVSRKAAEIEYRRATHEGQPAKLLRISSTSLNGMRVGAKFEPESATDTSKTPETRKVGIARGIGKVLGRKNNR
jgi:hypothetical protein